MTIRGFHIGLLAVFMASGVLQARAQEGGCIEYAPRCGEFRFPAPDLRGKTLAAARAQCPDVPIRRRGRRLHSDRYAAGRIAAQTPRPGACVSVVDKTVTVTLSQGQRCYNVPRVTPEALERGAVAMGPQQTRVRLRRRVVNSDRPRGAILGQTPEAGSCPRRMPDFITVMVSRGPPQCVDVPRVTPADAERGFVIVGDRRRVPVEIDRRHSNRHERGEVIEQKPEPGVCVENPGGIVLVLSAGPEPVVPPPERTEPPPDTGSGRASGLMEFVDRYWPGILAILAGLLLLAATASGKSPPRPDPARFAVRPRIDPGTQTATVPASIEGGRRNA